MPPSQTGLARRGGNGVRRRDDPVGVPQLALRGEPREALVPLRVRLPDGAQTTAHVAAYDLARTRVRLVVMEEPEPLASWCGRTGVDDALVGGFYVRPSARPLGELWTHGVRRPSVPFADPWAALRSCVQVDDRAVTLDR